MRLPILIMIIASCAFSQKSNRSETGTVDAHAATWIPPHCTFASPPASPLTHQVCVFEDASSLGVCAGSGTARATCEWSGSAWVATGGGGSGNTWGSITGTLSSQTDLFSALGGKQATGMVDILRFGLCYPAGCGSESTINYQATLANGTFSFCAFNLAVAPTGSSVIADVRNASGVSIFGATQLVIPVRSTAVVTQATFANSPQTFSSTDKFMAIITQNDSGNTAQGGLIQCR